ncbi:hypothetical protein QUF72_20185 [Desulfobacterales bacterium HSG2]|nr:hypothetical protein [Desulfobacterales bacterium HSG2]
MELKSAHEPEEKMMSASDVWDDAQRIKELLQQNVSKQESVVQLRVPLSSLLTAIDSLSQNELIVLHRHIQERLAI